MALVVMVIPANQHDRCNGLYGNDDEVWGSLRVEADGLNLQRATQVSGSVRFSYSWIG